MYVFSVFELQSLAACQCSAGLQVAGIFHWAKCRYKGPYRSRL